MSTPRRPRAVAFGALAIGVLTVRAAAAVPQDGNGPFPPRELTPGQSCLECHVELVQDARVHKPVRLEQCTLCHEQPIANQHTFLPVSQSGDACRECHPLPERSFTHDPVVEGDCQACHVPHSSNDRYLLRSSSDVALCGSCHQDQTGKDALSVHGPVAIGSCVLCHVPHASEHAGLLRDKATPQCISCHVDMNLEPTPWDSGAPAPNAPASVHAPVLENCTACHDAHASQEQYQLKKEPKALCLDCHQPFLNEVGARPVVHGALATNDGCVVCHDMHSAPFPKLLKKRVDRLCMECHDRAILRPDGTAFPGIAEEFASYQHLHGPVGDGNCSACHDPHGSVTFSILRDPYPERFYSPFSQEAYALCFRCHDVRAFTTETTTTLTEFRDGWRNLHYVHVNKDTKGRTCRACHDTHGGDNPLHIAKSVPFGNWELPVQFTRTPDGGSCASGCHVERSYVNRSLEAEGSR